ncbi:MAG: hypothetical protein DVB25_03145 [Verrucomicrobia bacterium]|nr:MAG: hypothetical protein DVB25_03145 [Verrucomicrobiota bacterium]
MLAHLYDLADELNRVAPWFWMTEDQCLGLRHPASGELAYMSLMGAFGGHHCLALYLGEEAFRRYSLMQSEDPSNRLLPESDAVALLLETRHLQVAFESRSQLARHELATIKQLGRNYRGDIWPAMRSFRPGYAPGPLDAAEILWLCHAIAQLLVVAPSLEADSCANFRLHPASDISDTLTRECIDGVWQNTWTPFDVLPFEFPTPTGNPAMIAKIAAHQRLTDVECLFQLMPSPVGSKPSAMIFPYLVISADVATGLIIGIELLSVEKQSHRALINSVPNVFMRQWDKAGIRPASLRVSTITAYSLLECTADVLNTPLRRHARLPAIARLLKELPF